MSTTYDVYIQKSIYSICPQQQKKKIDTQYIMCINILMKNSIYIHIHEKLNIHIFIYVT